MRNTNEINNTIFSKVLLKNLIFSRNPNFQLKFPVGNKKEVSLPISKICYLESDGVSTKLFLEDFKHSKVIIAQSLGECELMLESYAFIRIHRSYLVNCTYIESVDLEKIISITLSSGLSLPISRRRKTEIQQVLRQYGLSHLI